jgi:hypothetical protein
MTVISLISVPVREAIKAGLDAAESKAAESDNKFDDAAVALAKSLFGFD